MPRYELTGPAREAWVGLLKPLFPRGTQTKVVAALEASRRPPDSDAPGKVGETSWKPWLSHFCNGKEPGLDRILCRRWAVEVIAKTVNEESPPDFYEMYEMALGRRVVREDEAIVPGFEDWGPVKVSDLYEPPRGCGAGSGGAGAKIDDLVPSPDRKLDADGIARLVHEWAPDTGLGLLIVGDRGAGKTLFLKRLAIALRERHATFAWWREHPEPEQKILLCDDFETLEGPAREALRQLIGERKHVVVLTSRDEQQTKRLSGAACSVRLPALSPQFVEQVVHRLVQIGRDTWRRPVAADPMLRWLKTDPFSTHRLETPAAIGVHLRAIASGERTPVPLDALLKRRLNVARQRLDALGRPRESALVADFGASALAELVATAAVDDVSDVDANSFVNAIVAAGRSKDWAGFDGAQARTLVDALSETGVLVRDDTTLRLPDPYISRALLASSLVAVIKDDKSEPDLLYSVVLSPEAGAVAIGAAELLDDSAPVLRALLELPSGHVTQCAPVLTELLACHVACSDPVVARTCLVFLTAWWGQAFGREPDTKTRERLRLHGKTAIDYMVLASQRVQRLTPEPIEPAELLSPPVWRDEYAAYLQAMGWTALDAVFARTVTLILAPYHAPIEDLRRTRELLLPLFAQPPHGEHQWPSWYFSEGYEGWWRGVAPMAQEPSDRGRAMRDIMAGVAPGEWVGNLMPRNFFGDALWVQPLQASVKTRRRAVSRALADAVFAALFVPYDRNIDGLRTVFSETLPATVRPALDGEFLDRLILAAERKSKIAPRAGAPIACDDDGRPVFEAAVESIGPYAPDTVLEIVLGALFCEESDRERLWARWCDLAPQAPPWRVFRAVGLDPLRLVSWATEQLAADPASRRPDMELDGLGFPVKFSPEPHKEREPHSEADACLVTLAKSDDLDELVAVVIASEDFQHRYHHWALSRIVKAPLTEESRALRLRLASDHRQDRAGMLVGIWGHGYNCIKPRAGEGEWTSIAIGCPDDEKLGWIARACLADTSESPWALVLEYLEAFKHVHGEEGRQQAWRWERAAEMLVGAIAEGLARELPGTTDVMSAVFDSPILFAALCRGPLTWSLAWRLLGPEQVAARIDALGCEEPPMVAEALRCLVQIGEFDLVLSKVLTKEHGNAAASGLAQLTPRHPAGWFDKVFEHLDTDRAAVSRQIVDPGSPVSTLVDSALKHAPVSAAAWLRGVLPDVDGAVRDRVALRIVGSVDSPRLRAAVLGAAGW